MLTFEEVFTFEHLYDCAYECCGGVRWKGSTQFFESAMLRWAARLKDELDRGVYLSKGFTEFDIKERGKARHIQSIHISERAVQKCLVQHCLRPLVMPKLITSSHATLPGHGPDSALKELREHLRWWFARHGLEGGAATMDYHNHFGSIDHRKLKEAYSYLDMDDRLFRLTCYFIDCFAGDVGIGLGSEISQISAVFYLNPIDHFVKDTMGMKCYSRYMDDSIAIGAVDDLEVMLGCVDNLGREMGLTLNPKVTKITPLDRSFVYLKKRIHVTEKGRIVMRLDQASITRERRRLKDNAEMLAGGIITPESEEASWRSWLAHADKLDAHDIAVDMADRRAAALEKAFEGTPPRG